MRKKMMPVSFFSSVRFVNTTFVAFAQLNYLQIPVLI